ncbi:putative acetyltransferase [uncultured Thiomicrorhabdus sp.]
MIFEIKNYTPNDALPIADLYRSAVHAIDDKIYSKQQKEAWAPTPPDYVFWQNRLQQKQPFVAWCDNTIVGFIELEHDGHIDCAYTHPGFQQQGVMTALYHHLEQQAKKQKIPLLYVEASKAAQQFFENRGFETVKANRVKRNGEILINFSLQKKLMGL